MGIIIAKGGRMMILIWVGVVGWVLATAAVESALWRGKKLHCAAMLAASAMAGTAVWALVDAGQPFKQAAAWLPPLCAAAAFTLAAEAQRAIIGLFARRAAGRGER
ncbi:hypothetical protein [Novosphingobium cyanobacteriorum]|uniref:Uncharacterized protein n=1 Tax=Novosphingobium cyanobacteriorum TaxID=3024215 RepID=A0ABT6CHZ7_9SPHN|nr:hypothetical protein [Novosphingobium cyanobacteriorum]MDF8333553.1 hypothetical protein [Novosphingobium cyanobacteriorum]